MYAGQATQGKANRAEGWDSAPTITFGNANSTPSSTLWPVRDGVPIYAVINGSLEVVNSTFSGNLATSDGGAIRREGGSVALNHVTVAFNSADQGGGLVNVGLGSFDLKNTIVALNTAATADPDLQGVFTSSGHNLIGILGTAIGFVDDVNGDQVGDALTPLDPLLGPLQDNGGPTFTHALLVGSPAIDAADNTGGPATDQHGVARPQDGDQDGVSIADIGKLGSHTAQRNRI